MTSTSLDADSRRLALALHELLSEIDPARWRDERATELRERLDEIEERLEELRVEYAAAADHHRASIRARLAEIEAMVRAYAPDVSGTGEGVREAWMEFRDRAEPAYEALAASLRDRSVAAPSLRPTNYTRNLFHVLAAGISIAVVELLSMATEWGFRLVVVVAAACAASAWAMEIGRRVSERVNDFLMWVFSKVSHPHEAHHVNSSTWYVTALFLLSLTGSPLLCVAALAVLGIADPAAAVVGKRWGRLRLSNGRSIEGTATFIVTGTAAATVTVALLYPATGWLVSLAIGGAAATAGGITELFLRRIDDNLAIPVAAAAAAWPIAHLLGALG